MDGVKYSSGQFITSIGHLAKELEISVQQVRTALNKLTNSGEIAVNATNKFTVIKVMKWGNYQSYDDESNKQITNKQQSNNTQITNKQQQYKNIENKKNINNRVLNSAYPNVMNLADLYRESLKKN